MRILIIVLLFFFSFAQTRAQQGIEKTMETEERLSDAFNQLFKMEDSPGRDSLNRYILNTLSEALQTWDGYHYQWNSLNYIGRISTKDQYVKLFTWHLTNNSGKHKYYGVIAFIDGKKKRKSKKNEFRVVELTDNSSNMRNPQTLSLSADNWYGSVYYRITSFKHRRKTWYVLYGYDLNDNFSKRKSLEIMTLDNRGNIEFGGKIHTDKEELKRLIFEYSSQVVMSVNYDEKLDMIVWDHLSPLEPLFKGNYRFYGPDGSYDGLRFEKGNFYLEEDVDARNN